ASAFMAHALATTSGITTLLCHRDGVTLPAVVTQLWTDGVLTEVRPGPLGHEDIQAVVEARLGGRLGPSTLTRVASTVAGNPLYLCEGLDSAQRSNSLLREGDVWHWSGQWRAGPRLTALVEERLAALTASQRRLLELVAIAEPIEASVVLGGIDGIDA